MALRVVFAEDDYLVREGTSALLRESEDIELVAAVEDLPALLAAVEEHRPNAVLTDIRMPPTNTTEGIDAAHRIRDGHPETGVVVLSQYADEEYAYELLKEGAAGLGYLLKERVADITELVRAMAEVAKGGSVLDPKVVEALVARKDRLAHSPLAQLTEREREILGHLAKGLRNDDIASKLFISPQTVQTHVRNILSKLRVHSRLEAVAFAVRHGWLAV